MPFILSSCQVAVPDRSLHLGVVGNDSPTYALEEEAIKEEPQCQVEWSAGYVL